MAPHWKTGFVKDQDEKPWPGPVLLGVALAVGMLFLVVAWDVCLRHICNWLLDV